MQDKKLLGIIPAAILIEALITYTNQFFIKDNFHWQMAASLVIGVAICLLYRIDITEKFELKTDLPYIGSVITGLLLSRGSNYLFDLIGKFSA